MMSIRLGCNARLAALGSLARRHRSRVVSAAMLALTLIVLDMNGRAPRGVNLRPRELSATLMPAGERTAQKLGSGYC